MGKSASPTHVNTDHSRRPSEEIVKFVCAMIVISCWSWFWITTLRVFVYWKSWMTVDKSNCYPSQWLFLHLLIAPFPFQSPPISSELLRTVYLLNLLTQMQTKRDNIQIAQSPRGFSSTNCLLFFGFRFEWSYCGGCQKGKRSRVSVHESLSLVIAHDKMGMAHLRMNVLEQHCHSNGHPPPQMRPKLTCPGNWMMQGVVLEEWVSSRQDSGESMWGGGFLQNWKSYKIEGWKGNVALATNVEFDPCHTYMHTCIHAYMHTCIHK